MCNLLKRVTLIFSLCYFASHHLSVEAKSNQRIRLKVDSNSAHLSYLKTKRIRRRKRVTLNRVSYSSLPKGTVISIDPRKIHYSAISKVLVQSGRRYKRTNKNYFGGVRIHSVPGKRLSASQIAKLNKGNYFIHERHIPKSEVIRKVFNGKLPQGVKKIPISLAWDKNNPNKTWAHYADQALRGKASSLINGRTPWDIKTFCPRYRKMSKTQKRYFWTKLASEMTRYESASDPFTAADEALLGNYKVVSSGLLQMSLESVQLKSFKKKGCEVRKQSDLFDPKKNIQCALGMFAKYVKSDGCISCGRRGRKGLGRYWAVLRKPYRIRCRACRGGRATLGHKYVIAKKTRRLSFCRWR